MERTKRRKGLDEPVRDFDLVFQFPIPEIILFPIRASLMYPSPLGPAQAVSLDLQDGVAGFLLSTISTSLSSAQKNLLYLIVTKIQSFSTLSSRVPHQPSVRTQAISQLWHSLAREIESGRDTRYDVSHLTYILTHVTLA